MIEWVLRTALQCGAVRLGWSRHRLAPGVSLVGPALDLLPCVYAHPGWGAELLEEMVGARLRPH